MQPHDLTTNRLQNFGNIHSTILPLNTAQRPTAIILSMYLLSTHPQQQKWLNKRCTKVIVHFEWLWCIMRQHKVVCIAFLWKSESTLLCKAVTKLSVLTFLSYEVSKCVEIYHKLNIYKNIRSIYWSHYECILMYNRYYCRIHKVAIKLQHIMLNLL